MSTSQDMEKWKLPLLKKRMESPVDKKASLSFATTANDFQSDDQIMKNEKVKKMQIARPIEGNLGGSGFRYYQRYFFLLGTRADWFFLKNATSQSRNLEPYFVKVSALYSFNPGTIGQYVSVLDLAHYNRWKEFGYNVKCDSIKGSLKYLGLNVPHTTNAKGQATTSAQATLKILRGTGLERQVQIAEGILKREPMTGKPESFKGTNEIGVSQAESRFDFFNAQTSKLKFKRGLLLNDTAGVAAIDGADANFVEYSQIGAVCTSAILNKTSDPPSYYPGRYAKIEKLMHIADETETNGEILSWDYEMQECYLATQSIQQDSGFDDQAQETTETDSFNAIPQTSGVTAPFFCPGNFQSGVMDQFSVVTHHNVLFKGKPSESCFKQLPREYLKIIVPSLSENSSNTQLTFLQCVLDVEMHVSLSKDNLNIEVKD